MNSTVESIHFRMLSKFEYLSDLVTFNILLFQKFESDTTKEAYHLLSQIQEELDKLYIKYIAITSPILSSVDETKDLYQSCVTSVNFIDKLDNLYNKVKKIIKTIEKNSEIMKLLTEYNVFLENDDKIGMDSVKYLKFESKYDPFSVKNSKNMQSADVLYNDKLMKLYEENVVIFSIKLKSLTDCDCGAKMVIDTSTANKICEKCGYEVFLPGTLFEEPQHQNHQNPVTSRNKRYDSNRHCERWIKQIQAIEDVSGPAFNKVVEKLDKRVVKEYTKNGKLRNMENMKCAQIREWLKEYKLTTKWNDHAPLLRKTITGLHGKAVTPPQLTKEEEEDILMDFSLDMNLYEELSKQDEILQLIDRTKIKNKPYYPFGLLKVLCQKLKGDSRLQGLIESIHFQSFSTNVKNDKIHKIICQKRGKIFEPTDRTVLFRNQ